jgi:hypothetical protein
MDADCTTNANVTEIHMIAIKLIQQAKTPRALIAA